VCCYAEWVMLIDVMPIVVMLSEIHAESCTAESRYTD